MRTQMPGIMRGKFKLAVWGTGVGLLLASAAWACTAQPVIGVPGKGTSAGSGLVPEFGPPGTSVTVDGRAFVEGPVEIRWNSLGGQLLGSASGPSFSVQVTIPDDASRGTNYVVAFQRDALGNAGPVARASFEVTASSSGGTAPGTRPAGAASGGTTPGTQSSSPSQPSSASSTEPPVAQPQESSLLTRPETGAEGQSSAFQDGSIPAANPASLATPAAGTQSSPAAGGGRPVPISRPGGEPAPATAPSASGPLAPAPDVGEPVLTDEVTESSPRTVSTDVWSGLASGSFSAPLGSGGGASGSGIGGAIGVGLALLSAGMVALAAGLGFAEGRRRRPA